MVVTTKLMLMLLMIVTAKLMLMIVTEKMKLEKLQFQVGFGDMVPTKSFLGYEVKATFVIVNTKCCRKVCMASSKWWFV